MSGWISSDGKFFSIYYVLNNVTLLDKNVYYISQSSDIKQLVKFSLFLGASLVQVLILSWYGNNLIETVSKH